MLLLFDDTINDSRFFKIIVNIVPMKDVEECPDFKL